MSDPLAIAQGITEGLEKATNNIINIGLATYKIKQDKEKFNLDKKITNMQLKKLGYELDPAQLNLLTKKTQAEIKAKEAALNVAEITAETALSKEKREKEKWTVQKKWIEKEGYDPFRYSGGRRTYTPKQRYDTAVNLARSKYNIPSYKEPTQEQIQSELGNAEKLLGGAGGQQFNPEQRFGELFRDNPNASEDELYQMLADEMKELGL